MLSIKINQFRAYEKDKTNGSRSNLAFSARRLPSNIVVSDVGDTFAKNIIIGSHEVLRSSQEMDKIDIRSFKSMIEKLSKEKKKNWLELNGGHPQDCGLEGGEHNFLNQLTKLSKVSKNPEMNRLIKWKENKKKSETIIGVYERLENLQEKKVNGKLNSGFERELQSLIQKKDKLEQRNLEIDSEISNLSSKIEELKQKLKDVYYIIKE